MKYYFFVFAMILFTYISGHTQPIEKRNSYEYTFFSDGIDIKVREKRIGDSLELNIKFTNYKTVPIYIDTLYTDTSSGKIIGTDKLAWTINYFKLTNGLGNYGRYWHLQKIPPIKSFIYKCKIPGHTKYQTFGFGYFDDLNLLKDSYTNEDNGIKINIGKYYDVTDLDIGRYYEYGKKSIQKYMSYSIMIE